MHALCHMHSKVEETFVFKMQIKTQHTFSNYSRITIKSINTKTRYNCPYNWLISVEARKYISSHALSYYIFSVLMMEKLSYLKQLYREGLSTM